MKVFPILERKPGMHSDCVLIVLSEQEAKKIVEAVNIVTVLHDRIKSWQQLRDDMKKVEGLT